MSHESAALARTIRDHALHLHRALTPRVRRGVIQQVAPLVVELIDADVLIDADEMQLGAWLRLYDRMCGLEVGDTLFMYPLESGEWVVFDAATEFDFDEGLGPAYRAGGSAIAVGTSNIAVVFSTPMPDTNYSVSLTDTTGLLQVASTTADKQLQVTGKTINGFTVRLVVRDTGAAYLVTTNPLSFDYVAIERS